MVYDELIIIILILVFTVKITDFNDLSHHIV